ncbi:hypothetical protein AAG906_012170 [Vitis piasezkii]
MEILSCHSAPCCKLVNLRGTSVHKSSGSSQAKLPGSRNNRILCARIGSKLGSSGYSNLDDFCTKNLGRHEGSRSLTAFKGSANVNSKALSESYNGYLFWEWKPKLTVHYEKSGVKCKLPPVLFLPGFGVGSFHYEKQLKDLGRDFRVWAVDFLGQGMSLPFEDPAPQSKKELDSERNDFSWGFGDETEPWANELVYSIDLWQDQVRYFIEQVIGEPVYIVGNSLGGFVALYFAACNPQLVKGVTLLNATPFWGFLPNPSRSPSLARIFPWAGTFPLPAFVRKLTEFVLKQVYADHSTKTTQHPAAAASFASIMFAPQGQLSFSEALSRCQMSNVPICLMYGKEDPWVKPAPYYEISPAGHCPHDEVPEVVNYLLRGWIGNLESKENIQYGTTKDLEFVREGSKKSVRVHFYGSRFSLWNRIRSYVKSRFEALEINSR